MNVADLEVKVSYDDAQVQRGLNGLNDKVGKSDSILRGAASSMLGFIGAGVVMPAVGAAAGFVGDSLLGLSSRLEIAQNGFTNMLGSSQAASAHLEELKAFAAGTPFEFQDVAQASQRLLAMGIAADQVVPTLSSVGNAVAAMGGGQEQIDRVTMAIGQMNAKGKVSAEEMLQLAEAGIPAWDMLAQSIGKSVPETQKLVSEGQVAADQFLAAFNSEVPKRFGDSMAAQAQTLPGLMSTMKDTVSMGLAGMAGPLTESLKGAIGTLNQNLGPLMAAVGTAFGPLLGSLGEIVGLLASQLTPILTQLAPIIGETASILAESLGQALSQILPVLGSLLTAIAPVLPMLAELAGTIVGALAPVLVALGQALQPIITALVDGLRPVFDAIQPLIPQLVAAFMPLVDVLLQLLVALTPLIPPLIQMATGWTKLLPVILPIITAVTTFASELIARLIPAIQSIVGWLSEFLGALTSLDFGKVGEMLGDLWNTITTWVSEAISKLPGMLWDMATAFLGWLVDVIPEAVIKLGELWWAIESWILEKIVALPGLLLGWVTGFLSWVAPLLGQLPGQLLGIWVGINTWLLQKAAELPGLLLGWITGFLSWVAPLVAQLPGKLLDIANRIRDWATGLPGQLIEWVGDIGGKMLELGPKIVEGLWNGIKNMGDWLKDRVKDFAKGVIDGFKSGFGIFSPARTMFPVGEEIAAGLAVGIGRGLPLVTGAIGDITTAATVSPSISPQFAYAAATGGGTAGGDLTVNVYNGDPDEMIAVIERWARRNGPLPVAARGY